MKFNKPIILSSIDGSGLFDDLKLSHEETVKLMIKMAEDNMPQNYIGVDDLCGLVGQGKVRIGDTYVVSGFNKNWGRVPTTEIVYETFDNHWAKTVVTKVGPIPHIKGNNITRYIYFTESPRCKFPDLDPRSPLAKDYLSLFKMLNGGKQNA